MPGERHPSLQALSIPDLRNYVTSRFFAVMGRSLLHTTLVWHLYDITGEVLWLGVLGAVEFLPAIPVAFVGGALADRRDRRDILVASRSAAVLCAAGLIAGTGGGSDELWLLLGMALVIHTAEGFEFPAGQALLPALVPREIFQNAVFVSSAVRNAAFASGPVLAGLAIDASGPRAGYSIATGLMALSLIALLRIQRSGGSDPGARVGLESFREGLAFLRRRPALIAAMSLDMLC